MKTFITLVTALVASFAATLTADDLKLDVQEFTSAGTWIKRSTAYRIEAYIIGGGGGGASRNGSNSGAGGNGAPGKVIVITYYK